MPGARARSGFWRTSVARRIHLSFLLAAVLPLCLVAGSAYLLVTDRLQVRALSDAHRLARDVGMSIYERLQFVSDELRILAGHEELWHADWAHAGAGGLDIGERLRGYFVVGPGGGVVGSVPLSATEREVLVAALRGGNRSLPMLFSLGTEGQQRILMAVAVQPGAAESTWLGAELDLRHLWDTTGIAGRAERACVLGPRNVPIYCNHADFAGWLDEARGLVQQRGRPQLFDTGDGERLFTAVWSLFLRPHYQFERWTVLVGVPSSIALASIAAFDRVFIGAALVALIVAFGLGRRLIQRNLAPLTRLDAATEQLAAGNFHHRVQIHSGDEFQQLGDAFDGMAARIGDQFQELSIFARLDSGLQAAGTIDAAIEAAAEGLRSLVGPGRCALLCQERWQDTGSLWCRDFTAEGRVTRHATPTNAAGQPAFFDVTGPEEAAALLRSQLGCHVHGHARLIQVPSSDDVSAQIVLLDGTPEEAQVAARVADVLGITLGNLVLERRLFFQANHDWLSGLPNRLRLGSLFDEWVTTDAGACVGMLAIGVDRFKQVNDSLGHSGGDSLLAALGARLRAALCDESAVGRLEGDQFLVMSRGSDAVELVERLNKLSGQVRGELDRPFPTRLREVRLTATMSAALYPRDGGSFDAMLQCLDAARYAAKSARRGGLLFYGTGMREALAGRMELEQALKGAVANDELVLHYQPVVDAHSRRIRSAEALMRWQRPGVGLVMPGGFIDVAEQSGLIADLGNWAIGEACRQMQRWRAEGLGIDTVNVNVSSLQLADDEIERHVAAALKASGLPPDYLTLEVTETALIGQFEAGVARLNRLRSLGVRVLIDDFGTGYASLKYLKMLPVDGLKIDRLFVKDLPDSPADTAIVAAVVSLAQAASLKLVAEGIELESQARFLYEAGVPYLQGFLFAKGLTADELTARMRDEHASRLRRYAPRATAQAQGT